MAICGFANDQLFADYKKVGTGTLDSVRASNITPKCQYRLKATLSPSKYMAFSVTTLSELMFPTSPTFILQGEISREQVVDFVMMRSALFVSPTELAAFDSTYAKESILTTYPIRLELTGLASPRVTLVSRAGLATLKNSFWDLEADCDGTSTSTNTAQIPVTQNGSAACAGLGVLTTTATSPTTSTCACPYNAMTGGFYTPCGRLGAISQLRVTMYTDGRFTSSTEPPLSGATIAKVLGPVDVSSKYVFDAASCSCKLCDSNTSVPSQDLRSCVCKFLSATDVLNAASRVSADTVRTVPAFISCLNPPVTAQSPYSSPYNPSFLPNAIFSAEVCGCISCPAGKKPNAERSACVIG